MKRTWTLPWPTETSNHMYKVGRGHVHIEPSALAYKVKVGNLVRSRLEEGPVPPKAKMLTIYFEQFPPPGWHGDWDGSVKLVQDALFAGLRMNDYWVATAHVYRHAPAATVEEAFVEVTLEWADPPKKGGRACRGSSAIRN